MLLIFSTSVNINPDTDVTIMLLSADFNHRSVSQTLSVESRLVTEAEPSSSQNSPVNSRLDPFFPTFQALFYLQSLVYRGMKTAVVQNAVRDFQAPPVMQI